MDSDHAEGSFPYLIGTRFQLHVPAETSHAADPECNQLNSVK